MNAAAVRRLDRENQMQRCFRQRLASRNLPREAIKIITQAALNEFVAACTAAPWSTFTDDQNPQ